MKKLLFILLWLVLLSFSSASSIYLDQPNQTIFNGNLIYQLTNQGLVSVTHKNNHLFNLGIAVYGETPTPTYLKSWDTNWNWNIKTNTSNEITVEGTTNYFNFEWKQIWSFYSNKNSKIIHTLTNNTGTTINNMKMYYVFDVDTNKNPNIYYELNETKHRVNFNSDLTLNQHLNATQGKLIFDLPREPTIDFSDLFQDFDVNYLFIGNLNNASIDLPSTKGIILGVTKGNGTMFDGQTVILDPSISEGSWTSIDTWTGSNGAPWNTSIWEDVYTTGTTANTIQSNEGQLRVTDNGTDGRSNFVVKDAHKITLNSIGDVGYYEIEHKSTTDSGVNDTYTRLGIVHSTPKATNGVFLSSVFIGEFLTNGTYNASDTLINSTEDPDGQPIAFKIEKISATDVNVNVWVNGVKTMDNNTFGIGTDVDFYFKVYAITANSDVGAYTNLLIDDLNIATKSPELSISIPVGGQVYDSDDDLNITFDVFSGNPATDLLFDINYGLTTDTNTSILDDGNVASTANLFCDSNSLNPSKTCYFNWITGAVPDGDYYLKILITDNISSTIDSKTTGLFNLNSDPILRLFFRDENTDTPINPTTLNISINDGDINSWITNVVNGKLDINLSNYDSGKWSIVYGDATHSNRTFIQDINNNFGKNYVFGLLNDNNGNAISFTFYKQNGVTLMPDANIEVRDSNNHIAGKNTTDSTGKIIFYLNPNDGGYNFNINDSNGSDYNYSLTKVTIKQPLNEIDLTSAGNFRIRTSGISSFDLNNLSADTNIFLFNNTTAYHIIKISNVDANYFDRHYYLKLLGETEFYELQPYLLTGTDGTLTTITAKDSFTYVTIPNVLITIRKLIAGEASPVMVERILTDIVGTGTFVFKFNDDYIVDVNHLTLFETVTLNPVKTSYVVYISTAEETTDINTLAVYTDVNWLQSGLLTAGTSGYDLNFGVTSLDSLSYLDVNIENPVGTNIYSIHIDLNNLYSYEFGYTIPFADINDENSPIKVLYAIKYTNSPLIESLKHFNIARSMHWIYTDGFRDLWKDLGQPGTLFIVTLLGVFLTGTVGRYILKNQEYVLILAATIMAFFVYVGAIDIMAWTIATVLSFFVLIGRRGLRV